MNGINDINYIKLTSPNTEYKIALFGFEDNSDVIKTVCSIPNVTIYKVTDSTALGTLSSDDIFDMILINSDNTLTNGISSLVKNSDLILTVNSKTDNITLEEKTKRKNELIGNIYLKKQAKYKKEMKRALCKIEDKIVNDPSMNDDEKISALLNIYLRIMKHKNPSTFKHCINVSAYVDIFVDGLPMKDRPNNEQLVFLKRAALIHDIGKLCVLDEILLKDGKLTNEEYEAIKDHVSTESYLFESRLMKQFMSAALCHHLWFDGSEKSYPLEYSFLKEREIPYFSRIISVIDSFEAMTGDRTYKKPRSLDEVIEVIEAGKGTQFDPDIATTFINGIRLHPELEDMLHTVKSQKVKQL